MASNKAPKRYLGREQRGEGCEEVRTGAGEIRVDLADARRSIANWINGLVSLKQGRGICGVRYNADVTRFDVD